MAEESIAKPFYTVLILAFICSALVAGCGGRTASAAGRQP